METTTDDRQGPVFEGESSQAWERLRKQLAKGDIEGARTTLIGMDLSPKLAKLFLAVIEDEVALSSIIVQGQGQKTVGDEAQRKLELLAQFPPKNMPEAEKVATQKRELQATVKTAADLVLRAQAAENPRAGLYLAFFELFSKEPTPHSGFLTSWMPSTHVCQASAKLNVGLFRLAHWRTVKAERTDEQEEAERQRMYRSF
jgi:hypothetical protein